GEAAHGRAKALSDAGCAHGLGGGRCCRRSRSLWRGRWRLRDGQAGVGSGQFDYRDLDADRDRGAFWHGDPDQRALKRRGDLGVHLVGDHLDEGLVTLDVVAFLFKPSVHVALADGLAELRHLDRGYAPTWLLLPCRA